MRYIIVFLIFVAVLQDFAATDQAIHMEDRLIESNIETCPAGCDCQDFATCNWSIYGAAVIETTSQNTTEWINTARKILEYTCNDEMHAVCCCGPEQLAPDFQPLPSNFNVTAFLERHDHDRWGFFTAIWNAVQDAATWVKNAVEDVAEWVEDAWNTVMDSIQALAMAIRIKDKCGSKLQIDSTKIQTANDKMKPYRKSKTMGKEEEQVLKENMASFDTEVESFRSCMAGANRGVTIGAQSVSFGVEAKFGAMVSGDAGVAFTTTGDGRKLYFMGACSGIGFDAEIGISLNIGLWRNIEDIPGESMGFGLGFDLQAPGPAVTVGAGVELLWNMPQGEFIGVTVNFGFGAGLSPVDVTLFLCDTPLTLYVGGKCDAQKNDWGCCTDASPCGLQEGDCDTDSECRGSELVCGNDNCQAKDPSWGTSTFDCCRKAGCIEFDTDYYGYDLSNGKSITTTWQECEMKCRNREKTGNDQYDKCYYWTFFDVSVAGFQRGSCLLKSRKDNPRSGTLNGLISGSRRAKDCKAYCTEFNVDYMGNDLNAGENLKTGTWQECANNCEADSDCHFWTWISPDYSNSGWHKLCFLKDSKSGRTTSNSQGLVSGSRVAKDCRELIEIKTSCEDNSKSSERLKITLSQSGRSCTITVPAQTELCKVNKYPLDFSNTCDAFIYHGTLFGTLTFASSSATDGYRGEFVRLYLQNVNIGCTIMGMIDGDGNGGDGNEDPFQLNMTCIIKAKEILADRNESVINSEKIVVEWI